MDGKSNEKKSNDETIQVYLRIRPTINKVNHININDKQLEVLIPKNINSGFVNNTKEKYKFVFDKIFDMSTKQDRIFQEVAKEVVESSMDGYNGTIFAYGQTGSGKTYTITGGAERMEERGIIPRTISHIFREIKQRTSHKWKIYISYLEIYNNDGYDLLHESNGRSKNLEDLPRVKIRENANKQFLLYNLSVHNVENEEEAMLLLLLGDENRVVAETPKNDASTRSHCIFMFQIESQKYGEDVKTLSKLHIVDLSGSEKPYKTDLSGIRMEEALNINLSLHFLEQVIVSLNKKEGHIPYRNSMMTMCLRDSLGGNCKTRMIATLSAEAIDVMESMSTCRFGQRVALIKNVAMRNEIEDPSLIIQKQKQEIEDLKSELALVKGTDQKSVLDNEDIINCKKIVDDYVKDDDYSKTINLKDMLMINECFSIIKVYYKDLQRKVDALSGRDEVVLKDNYNIDKFIEVENSNKKLKSEIDKLKELIKRRDEEIKILLAMLDKQDKQKANSNPNKTLLTKIEDEDNAALNKIKNNILGNIVNFKQENNWESELNNSKTSKTTNQNTIVNNFTSNNNNNSYNLAGGSSSRPQMPLNLLQEINTANSYLSKEIPVTFDFLSDRTLSYNQFKKHYIKGKIIEDNLKILDEKFEKGKEISKNVASIRIKISLLKNEIIDIRKMKIIENVDENDPIHDLKLKEENLLNKFSQIKIVEKKDLNILQEIHNEIKTMQATNEAYTAKMTKDFEFWVDVMSKKIDWEKARKLQVYINDSDVNLQRNNDTQLSTDLKDISDRYNLTKNKIMAEIGKK